MGFRMKGSPAKLGTIQGTAGHASALKMKMEEKSAAKLRAKKAALKMKMEKDSPAKIPLKGKQHNLPEELKAKIKASPGKMKKDSPMDMKKESPTKILGAVAKVAGKVGKAVGKVQKAGDKIKGAFTSSRDEARNESPAKLRKAAREVGEGFKTIGRKLTPSAKNIRKGASDVKEGFRHLFTGDRTDSRVKKSPNKIKHGGKTSPDREKRPHLYKDVDKKQMAERFRKAEKRNTKKIRPSNQGGLRKMTKEDAARIAKLKDKKSPNKMGHKKSAAKMGHKKSAAKMKKETPNKWMLTAAKAVGKGLTGRSKAKDAKDAAKQAGLSSMTSV